MKKEQPLGDFLLSDIGRNLWDSDEVRLMLDREVVFVLKMNSTVELDKINLINKESEFTIEIEKYIVEDYKEIEGINYIFIKEKNVGFKNTNPGVIIDIKTGDTPKYEESFQIKNYLKIKQNEVLGIIEPICHAFGIYYFDYEIDEHNQETLVLEKQKINCSMNSYKAIIEEVLGYIIVKKYRRYLDEELKDKLYKVIQRSWHKNEKEGE